MFLIPIRASFVKKIICNKKVFKTANKICLKYTGCSVKENIYLFKNLYEPRKNSMGYKVFKELTGCKLFD